MKIIVDSTFDMPKEARDSMAIVPLTVRFGDKEYVDGVSISKEKFYEMLIESDELPTTSQASPFAFATEIEKAIESGEDVLVITVAGGLSGTYQSACIAASEYPDKVFVVDSESVAIGAGILAQRALELMKSGLSAKETADILNEEKKKICLIALLDTLEYLKKGGRVSKAVAIAGGILSIKPVVAVKNGEIIVLGKARGSKMGNNLLNEQINVCGGVDFSKPILFGYTGLSDRLLNKYIEDSQHIWKENVDELEVSLIGSVIGTHAGPDAVAVAFFGK